jgi:hypothetical protein
MTNNTPTVCTLGVPFLDEPDSWSALNRWLQHAGYGDVHRLDSGPGWRGLRLTDGRYVRASGSTRDEMAGNLLRELNAAAPELFEPWERVRRRARLGDFILKLVWQLGLDELGGVPGLQAIESDQHLTDGFETLRADHDLGCWGPGLGRKKRATLVEAWIARRVPDELKALVRRFAADLNSSGLVQALP